MIGPFLSALRKVTRHITALCLEDLSSVLITTNCDWTILISAEKSNTAHYSALPGRFKRFIDKCARTMRSPQVLPNQWRRSVPVLLCKSWTVELNGMRLWLQGHNVTAHADFFWFSSTNLHLRGSLFKDARERLEGSQWHLKQVSS